MYGPAEDLVTRAQVSLGLMHRWGYAPTLHALASGLLGGMVGPAELERGLRPNEPIRLQDGFVCLKGYEHLLPGSGRRVASNRSLNGDAWRIAKEYASDLVRLCPFVDCVAVSGSLASGGYDSVDDIDFDLFVKSGTKYTTYLLASLIGLKYSWRYRGRRLGPMSRVFFFPKIMCVNVIWPDDQTKPFVRQDADLAFELLRCRPILGAEHFARIIAANGWARTYFPQLGRGAARDEPFPSPNPVGRFVLWVARRPRLLRAANEVSRVVTHAIYSFVHWMRRNDPESMARLRFLQRVKFPYEVFQD